MRSSIREARVGRSRASRSRRSSTIGAPKQTALVPSSTRTTTLAVCPGRRHRSPGRYTCHVPVICMWVCRTEPSANRIRMCLPVASTAVISTPGSGPRRPPGSRRSSKPATRLPDERGPQLRGHAKDRVAFGHTPMLSEAGAGVPDGRRARLGTHDQRGPEVWGAPVAGSPGSGTRIPAGATRNGSSERPRRDASRRAPLPRSGAIRPERPATRSASRRGFAAVSFSAPGRLLR